MMKLAKYQFDSQEQFETKFKALGVETDEDGNEVPNHKHVVVRLGHIVIEEAEYDEEGVITKEAVYSTKYAVDMAFFGLDAHPYGWKSYSIDVVGEGVHSFAGVSYQDNKF